MVRQSGSAEKAAVNWPALLTVLTPERAVFAVVQTAFTNSCSAARVERPGSASASTSSIDAQCLSSPWLWVPGCRRSWLGKDLANLPALAMGMGCVMLSLLTQGSEQFATHTMYDTSFRKVFALERYSSSIQSSLRVLWNAACLVAVESGKAERSAVLSTITADGSH